MADDLKKTVRQEDERINVDQDHEVTYWSQKLGVSRDQLREAVAKAGPVLKNVERQLAIDHASEKASNLAARQIGPTS
jgi:hypothetical protein